MSERVGLNPKWFEPGPDGKSRFTKLYRKSMDSGLLVSESIAAAFRALLAGEDCGHTVDAKDAEIAELCESLERTKLALNTTRQQRDNFWSQRDAARADLARLKNECSDQQSYVLDLESAIARKDTRIKVLEVANDSLTQYSSYLTTERDALQASLRDEQAKRASIEAELVACRESRDALQATVERLNKHNINLQADLSTAKRDIAAINSYWAEADAKAKELQARIDGGVRVWGDYLVWGQLEEHDTHTGIVIDVEKIRPDVVEMADERKGEEVVNSTGIQYRGHWLPFHNRRRTTGTIADRKEAS